MTWPVTYYRSTNKVPLSPNFWVSPCVKNKRIYKKKKKLFRINHRFFNQTFNRLLTDIYDTTIAKFYYCRVHEKKDLVIKSIRIAKKKSYLRWFTFYTLTILCFCSQFLLIKFSLKMYIDYLCIYATLFRKFKCLLMIYVLFQNLLC